MWLTGRNAASWGNALMRQQEFLPRGGVVFRITPTVVGALGHLFLFFLLHAGLSGCADLSSQGAGPKPVSPSQEIAGPPPVSPPPEKPTEVPIGRLKGYEEEKQKAQEKKAHPSGTMQQDTGSRRQEEMTGSGESQPREGQ